MKSDYPQSVKRNIILNLKREDVTPMTTKTRGYLYTI